MKNHCSLHVVILLKCNKSGLLADTDYSSTKNSAYINSVLAILVKIQNRVKQRAAQQYEGGVGSQVGPSGSK